MQEDLDFLKSGAEIANEAYAKALKENRSTEQKIMGLPWSAVGFDELRNHKPYAILVRFMPYKSLTDAKLRELEQVEDAMRKAGMTVVGVCVSNCTPMIFSV